MLIDWLLIGGYLWLWKLIHLRLTHDYTSKPLFLLMQFKLSIKFYHVLALVLSILSKCYEILKIAICLFCINVWNGWKLRFIPPWIWNTKFYLLLSWCWIGESPASLRYFVLFTLKTATWLTMYYNLFIFLSWWT